MRTTPISAAALGASVLALALTSGCQTRHARPIASSRSEHLYARGAVAADHALASQAGARMLAIGGNAVDAAVAASFTLSVVRPYSCGLGGGGFMVVYLPDDPFHGFVHSAINYRETSYVGPDYFQRSGRSSTVGGAGVAIPGTTAGLLLALETYGTLDRETVIAPAVEAARSGFVVDDHYEAMARRLSGRFEANPEWKSRYPLVWEHFLREGEIRKGQTITNERQGRALELIARDGMDAINQGPIGAAIIDAVKNAGGEMTLDELVNAEPIEYEPMLGEVNGYTLIAMPPPSSGGITMIETMRILGAAGFDFDDPEFTDEDAHLMSEALKHAFADRSAYLADPEYVRIPVGEILDKHNIDRRAGLIDAGVHPPSYYGTAGLLPGDSGTSHLCVIDPFGGAVACTETINLEFGSLVGVDEFGFVLNNEMDDFAAYSGEPNAFGLVQSDRNAPAPGKRPLSSMSPTIVLDGRGRIFAIAGASGGPRIITGTMQVILNAMAGMDAMSAVGAPRIHHQWKPDVLYAEPGIYDRMRRRQQRGRWNSVEEIEAVGAVQLILRDAGGRGWRAASDPRKGGRPAGID